MVKGPFSADTARDSMLVALFCATISAPGMIAPETSTTVPEIEDVAPPCAYAVPAASVIAATSAQTDASVLNTCFMERSSFAPTQLCGHTVRWLYTKGQEFDVKPVCDECCDGWGRKCGAFLPMLSSPFVPGGTEFGTKPRRSICF